MNKQNIPHILFISLISALGGFLFGYDWVVIGGAKPFYEPFFEISNIPTLQGWAMSSALVGCLIGALWAGPFSNRYGRKTTLIAAAIIFLISAIGMGACDTFGWFIFYRIFGGLGIGFASNISPMYIAEISPAPMRGRLVSLNQLTIVLGILSAQVTNWLIAEPVPVDATAEMIRASWNGQEGWRWMFWVEAIPSLIFLLFSLVIPESPRWLTVKERKQHAIAVMAKISGLEQATLQYTELEQSIIKDKTRQSTNQLSQILHPSMRKVLTIGIALAVFQQWCGINVIFNYAQEVFSEAGYSVSDILMNIVITGVINVLFTILAIFLVDRIGRRLLLCIGAAGLSIIYLLMGGAYYFDLSGIVLLIIVILAIGCYAMTLAPITWVIISEIFPNTLRGMAMSISTFMLWTASFILTYTFPLLNTSFGASGTFWTYGAICLLGFLFIYNYVPETKNKTLEDIEKELIK